MMFSFAPIILPHSTPPYIRMFHVISWLAYRDFNHLLRLQNNRTLLNHIGHFDSDLFENMRDMKRLNASQNSVGYWPKTGEEYLWLLKAGDTHAWLEKQTWDDKYREIIYEREQIIRLHGVENKVRETQNADKLDEEELKNHSIDPLVLMKSGKEFLHALQLGHVRAQGIPRKKGCYHEPIPVQYFLRQSLLWNYKNNSLHDLSDDGNAISWEDVNTTTEDVLKLWPVHPKGTHVLGDHEIKKSPVLPGRPKGSGSLDEIDRPLLTEMAEILSKTPSISMYAAACKLANRAGGGGTEESKAKRLQKKFKQFSSGQLGEVQ